VKQERCKIDKTYQFNKTDLTLECSPSFTDPDLISLWNDFYKPKLDLQVKLASAAGKDLSSYLSKPFSIDAIYNHLLNSLLFHQIEELLEEFTPTFGDELK
jgi:hypothetical protein